MHIFDKSHEEFPYDFRAERLCNITKKLCNMR
jgi:hypothetical protein